MWAAKTGKAAFLQERFGIDTRLFQNRAQRPFRHVARMIGYGGVTVQSGVEPDFMGTRGLSMKDQAELLQPPDDVAITKAGQRPHQVAMINW